MACRSAFVNIGLGEWPISTYMSLTLARLCGEWQLVSGANYSRYEYFVSRKPLRKAESRYRKQKVVEEIGKPLKKIFLGFLGYRKAVEENRILSKENWILGEGNLDIGEGFHDISERLSSDPS